MRRLAATGLSKVVLLACSLGLSTATIAEDFSTDFEVPDALDVTTADTFTLADGALEVEFAGGTVFTAGQAELYRNGSFKSWMVEPLGVNGSSGIATATVSEGATSLRLYGRAQANVIAFVEVLDTGGTVIRDADLPNAPADWIEIEVNRGTGQSLIESVVFKNFGGGVMPDEMAAIEDFEFSTDRGGLSVGGGSGDGSSSTAIGPLLMIVLAVGWVAGRSRRS